MRILALQPYDAASHRAFLEGWQRHSRHDWTTLTLPGRHFKWRVRQAPIDFAGRVCALYDGGELWQALWCTSMLDLAVFRGLCPPASAIPAAVYFHENQLAYPARYQDQRDIHFGLTNMNSALAAIASGQSPQTPCVWWNSAYNRDSFLDALEQLLKQMPDHQPMDAVQTIRQHSAIYHPGIDPVPSTVKPKQGPPVLLWAARWEHDKAPELFFEAIDLLLEKGIDFRLSVVGEQFKEGPVCFDRAHKRFAGRIVHWGYQPSREAYEQVLRESDIVVSTARHEFFGIAIAEAVSAGCTPVLPDALVYPELWDGQAVFHDQTPQGIASAIERAITQLPLQGLSSSAARFSWPGVAGRLDDAIEALAR